MPDGVCIEEIPWDTLFTYAGVHCDNKTNHSIPIMIWHTCSHMCKGNMTEKLEKQASVPIWYDVSIWAHESQFISYKVNLIFKSRVQALLSLWPHVALFNDGVIVCLQCLLSWTLKPPETTNIGTFKCTKRSSAIKSVHNIFLTY